MPPLRSLHCVPRLAEREAELGAHLLIEQYKAQLHKLPQMKFGRSSETLDTLLPSRWPGCMGRGRCRRPSGFVFFEIFEAQFQLMDQSCRRH